MSLNISWRSHAKPLGWVSLGLLATAVVVSALVSPGSHFLPEWRSEELSTVLPARIKPSSTFDGTAELQGRVVSILVAPGQQVSAGEKLAILESDELNDELESARRRVRFAQSRISVLRGGDSKGTKRVQRERYQSAVSGRKAARERLSGYSVGDMEKVWNEARKRTAQVRSLLDQQLATSAELDEAQAREQEALNSLKAAREHWSRLKQESELAESQLRMARVEPGKNSDALLSVQLELEDAREALKQIRQKEQAKTVSARRAGTVLRVNAHPGDRVTAGEALLQIADLSELSFEVPVSAGVAEQIHPGRAVVVRIPTDPPRKQPASVSSVLLSPDQDHPSYIVRITIPNPNPAAILAGLEGAVEFPHLGSQWKRRLSY